MLLATGRARLLQLAKRRGEAEHDDAVVIANVEREHRAVEVGEVTPEHVGLVWLELFGDVDGHGRGE